MRMREGAGPQQESRPLVLMHAPQAAVVPGQQQQELQSSRYRAKRKAPSPPVPFKRFIPDSPQHGLVAGRCDGGEGDGSRAALGTCKRKRESVGGSPAREKKLQRGEAPGEQQQEEDLDQFSTFQYWRTPLPKLDLSDLDLAGGSMAEDMVSSSAEGIEGAMES